VPLNQFGTATVAILDRVRWIGSARLEQIIPIGDGGAGIKLVGYGEVHDVPSGQRETRPEIYEDVPRDSGWVVGGQVGGFTGERDTHVNLFVRYARGLAAYDELAAPDSLGLDRTAADAHELLVALGGNWEIGPLALMLGAYFRSFRNASVDLDFGDVDEGIVVARPAVFFTDWLGLAVEGSYQAQQHGVLADIDDQDEPSTAPEPLTAGLSRLGVVPFVTPAGRGSYSRPIFWFIYTATFRDDGARALYPVDDVFRQREIDHFIGLGAEWWFGSTSYGDEE
jgi:maltoporin